MWTRSLRWKCAANETTSIRTCWAGIKACTNSPTDLPPLPRKRQSLAKSTFPATSPPQKKTGPLDQLFDIKGKNDLDTVISAVFYRYGIPFNVARSAEYHDMVQALINYRLPYVPPSYDELGTTLLEAMCFSFQQRLSSFLANIYETGCSLVLDEWTDPCGRPLVNFIIVTPDGAMFYDCINTFGKSKDGKAIFLEIQKVIDIINPAYITNVVTDNAGPMVSAGRLIEKKFRRIVWTRCHSHCVDLLLEIYYRRWSPLRQSFLILESWYSSLKTSHQYMLFSKIVS
ncbi:hypothetical protein GEMRC1_008849 [Eukaryota sp. GEM-RC1]